MNAEKLNRTLYDPVKFPPTDTSRKYHQILNESLDKVKSFKGETYRVISSKAGSPELHRQLGGTNLATMYEPGKTVKLEGFVSSSKSKKSSYKPYDGAYRQIRLTITSKTGKWVEKISHFKKEREVLYKSGLSYRVDSRVWNSDRQTWDIHMTEL